MLPSLFEKEFNTLEKFFSPPFFNQTDNFPRTDIFIDSDDNLVFELALAGFNKDDLNVSFEDGKLVLSGKNTDDQNERKYIQKKISYRNFELAYIIPVNYNKAEPQAKYTNGILTVKLEKNTNEERKLITIK